MGFTRKFGPLSTFTWCQRPVRVDFALKFGVEAFTCWPSTGTTGRESSQLLREFDNVAVRVGDVERPFMPWPIHRSAEDLDTEPS